MMTHHWVVAAGLIVGACAAAAPTTAPSADAALDGMRWKRRVLVVFASSVDHAELRKQRGFIEADAAGYAERELTVIEVVGGVATIDRQSVAMGELRRKLDATADRFQVLLVGKDGGVKRRETAAIASDDLFGTIDAMPMRKEEMR